MQSRGLRNMDMTDQTWMDDDEARKARFDSIPVPIDASIKRTVHYFERLKEEAEKTHVAVIKRLNEEISKIRRACSHPAESLSYNPDPSGNNDTSYTCKVCGLEKKRF